MLDSYKCSNCGGYMDFDTSSGKLRCLSCKQEELVENYEAQYESFTSQDDTNIYQDEEARQYICKKCDSAIVTDNRSAISVCPFCGGQTSLGDRLSGEWAPTHVIPFKISRHEAVRAFKKWCHKLPFSPQDFPKNHEVKKVTGIYLPVMCYDLRGQGEAVVDALRRKKLSTPEDEREEISYYQLYRKNDLHFRHVPVSNSKNIDDSLLDKLCPYHFTEMEPFSPAHLEGHLMEKNAIAPEDVMAVAEKKAERYMEDYVIQSISNYEDANIQEKNFNIGKESSKYILLPLWLVMYDYNNREYIFAMNGQTGKIACEPPRAWIKIGTCVGLIALATFLLLRIITLLLGGPLL